MDIFYMISDGYVWIARSQGMDWKKTVFF